MIKHNAVMSHVDHIGIAVSDPEPVIEMYERLGFNYTGSEVVVEQGVEVFMLEGGETRIELLKPLDETSPVSRHIARRGAGLHHIAVTTDNIEKALSELGKSDVKLIDKQPRIGAGGHKIAFVHPKSTGGVLLELTQENH